MARLEYINSIISLEMESSIGGSIDLKSKEFDDFIKILYEFNKVATLKRLDLSQDNMGIYNYRIESKEGAIANYFLDFKEGGYSIKFTTEETWWFIAQDFSMGEKMREHLFILVKKFNINQLEIIFT